MISLAEDCRRIQPCCEGFPAVGVQIYGHFVGYRNQYPLGSTYGGYWADITSRCVFPRCSLPHRSS